MKYPYQARTMIWSSRRQAWKSMIITVNAASIEEAKKEARSVIAMLSEAHCTKSMLGDVERVYGSTVRW